MAKFDLIAPAEAWRPVSGWEDCYSVSTLGRVRRDKTPRRRDVGHIMSPRTDRYGYLTVLLRKSPRHRYVTVHRLVAEAFLGPMPEGMTIDHKDGVKSNNRASNLEYVTAKENSRRCARLGLMTHGEACHSAKLTAADIPGIRKKLAAGTPSRVIAAELRVSNACIWKIERGVSWKHV